MQNYRLEGLFKNRKVGTDEVANPTADYVFRYPPYPHQLRERQ